MKIRPKLFIYTIKKIKLKLLNKTKKIDFEGYYSAQTLNLKDKGVTGYEPCYNYSKLLRKCKVTKKDAFLDIGSGKGCALYYARKFPFALIDGIEISKELSTVAQNNLKIIKDDRLHAYCIDAREFKDYGRYNYFYFYNPCNEEVMENILDLILESYKNNKRIITVIYQTPKHKSKFIDKGFEVMYDNKKSVVMRLYNN